MKKNYKCRVTIIMAILSLLFGCSGNKKYNAGDIIGASTSYYGTECDPVYAFSLQKQDENWLFSASCYVQSKEGYTSFDSFPIPAEDAEGFLEIIREEDEISRLSKYRPLSILHAADAPTNSSVMTFSDGNSIEKGTAFCDKALRYLYSLAEKHYETAENVEITSVFVSCSSMDHSSSYSYTLEKDENTWYFSFDAVIDGSGAHTQVERQKINENDAEEILRIIKNQQLVTMVRQYEEPDDDGLIALDETTYRLSFDFTDGTSKSAPIEARTHQRFPCTCSRKDTLTLIEPNYAEKPMEFSESSTT